MPSVLLSLIQILLKKKKESAHEEKIKLLLFGEAEWSPLWTPIVACFILLANLRHQSCKVMTKHCTYFASNTLLNCFGC